MEAASQQAGSIRVLAPVDVTGWIVRNRNLLLLVGVALASRLFLLAIATPAAATIDQWPAGTWNRGPAWVQPFVRWDSGYYLDIAAAGYGASEALWAFHPGYPLIIRGVTSVASGLSPEVAGFLVSNACFLVGVVLLYRWSIGLFGEGQAFLAASMLSWYPGSFYFSAVYSEAVFFLFIVLALWSFTQGHWLTSGLLATLANAMRPHGLFLAPAFALVLAWRWYQHRNVPWRAWLAPALAPAFIVVFSLFAWQQTGDPLMWVHARETYWPDVRWHDPLYAIGRAFDLEDNRGLTLIGLSAMILATLAAIRAWRSGAALKAPVAHAFAAVLLLVNLTYSAPHSMLRFSVAAVPVFWMLASWASTDRRLVAIMMGNALLSAYTAYLFATWGPAY